MSSALSHLQNSFRQNANDNFLHQQAPPPPENGTVSTRVYFEELKKENSRERVLIVSDFQTIPGAIA
jgi:hypothetical protein